MLRSEVSFWVGGMVVSWDHRRHHAGRPVCLTPSTDPAQIAPAAAPARRQHAAWQPRRACTSAPPNPCTRAKGDRMALWRTCILGLQGRSLGAEFPPQLLELQDFLRRGLRAGITQDPHVCCQFLDGLVDLVGRHGCRPSSVGGSRGADPVGQTARGARPVVVGTASPCAPPRCADRGSSNLRGWCAPARMVPHGRVLGMRRAWSPRVTPSLAVGLPPHALRCMVVTHRGRDSQEQRRVCTAPPALSTGSFERKRTTVCRGSSDAET